MFIGTGSSISNLSSTCETYSVSSTMYNTTFTVKYALSAYIL